MLCINTFKQTKHMFKSNPIDFILVNWNLQNNDVYLTNFKYNNENNYITFDSIVNSNLWCFKLNLCDETNKSFIIESLNSETEDDIKQIIYDINTKFSMFDYSEFIEFCKLTNLSNYNVYNSVLTQFLNEFNDTFIELDIASEIDVQDNIPSNIYESSINVDLNNLPQTHIAVEDNEQIINCITTKIDKINENEDEDEEEVDIYGNEDEINFLSTDYKNKFFLDVNSIISNSLEYIKKHKMESMDLQNKIQNFSDINRIQMLINEVNNINAKFDDIQIYPVNDNIFELSIVLSKLKNIDCIIMTFILNSNLYPYYPPKINFNVCLQDNLEYLISSLDYFKVTNWNPTNTLEHTVVSIRNILDEHAQTISGVQNNELNKILNDLSIYTQIKPNSTSDKHIEIKFISIDNGKKLNKVEYVGYGSNNRHKFDIKSYINSVELKNQMIERTLELLNCQTLTHDDINKSCILPMLKLYFRDIQLIDVNKYENLYYHLFLLLNNIILQHYDVLTDELLVVLCDCKNMLLDYKLINPEFAKIELELYDIITKIDSSNSQINISSVATDIKTQYVEYVKKNNYELVDKFIKKIYVPLDGEVGKYCNNISRISKEMVSLKKNIPVSWESSIFAKFNKDQMSLIKFAIIGPKDTPYENGFFEFHVKLGESYPTNNPSCHFQTTGSGRVRFNPNLYESGKVCLSLLGTWSGHESEQWNGNTSTLLQLLLSIQSLILCEQPYFNEPGWESSYGTLSGIASSNNYNRNIQKYTIMYAIIEQIKNPPENFEQQIYGHFYFKKNEILECFNKWLETNNEIKTLKQDLINALEIAENKYKKNV